MSSIFKKWNKAITVIVLLSFTTVPCAINAQSSEKNSNPKYSGGFGYFSFAGEQLNFDGLNKTMSANGYSKINNKSGSFGGGGYFMFNNFMIGGSGASLMNTQTSSSSNSLSLKGGYGFCNIGYMVYSGKRSLLYPAIGVGGGGYDIALSKNNFQGDFTQQLNAPTGMLTAKAGGWMLNAQLTYQHFLSKSVSGGWFIGLKAGYRFAPTDWNITVNNNTLNNSPKINMNGAYISILLGGGGLSSN